MNKKDFSGATIHGDAWRYFVNAQAADRRLYSHEEQQERWRWFLKGWGAKCMQRERML